jgi:LacI family transcriptional regulator
MRTTSTIGIRSKRAIRPLARRRFLRSVNMGRSSDDTTTERAAGGTSKPRKPAGIRDIAKAIGVSIGTVDRALHGRPGISEKTRQKILKRAQNLGYRPNLAASLLSSKRRLAVGINLPREIASFFDVVRAGIADVARSAEARGVRLVYRTYERFGEGESEALAAALDDDLQGLLIAPGRPHDLAPLLERAARQNLPVVCVNTDAPKAPHLCTIGVDSMVTGALVGEMLGRFLGGRGRVLVVTGQVDTIDHAQKLEGFRKTLRELWPKIEIAAVVEAHDDAREAYQKCSEALAGRGTLPGIYVSTANSIPVLQALEEQRPSTDVTVVTTDLFPALVPYLRSGRVAATVHQRPRTQGEMAFTALYRFLTEGTEPPATTRLSPHIVMRSNLELFLDGRVRRS